MVTLLGFFFILGNVGLCAIFMPDLIGPVCYAPDLEKPVLPDSVLIIAPGTCLAVL
jgi:hypothetical protein